MIDTHPGLPGINGSVFVACLTQITGEAYRLDREGEVLTALRATGCLVDPEPGDLVLAVSLGDGIHSILTVLSRAAGPLSVTCPDGLTLVVPKGPLDIQSGTGTTIHTPTLKTEGESVRILASEMVLGVTRFTLVGEAISFVASRIEQLAKTVETVAHWISEKAHMATREIETVDHSRAGQTLIESDTVLSLESKTTLVNAREWFKVDSDQIHLG